MTMELAKPETLISTASFTILPSCTFAASRSNSDLDTSPLIQEIPPASNRFGSVIERSRANL